MGILQGKYNFNKDIDVGERGEDIMIGHLKTLGFKFLNKNNDYRYDYKMQYGFKTITYEQKTDVYPRDTGNLVIEFECRGKPSGIAVTDADYFVIFFPHFGEVWNIRTPDLINLINYIKPFEFTGAGDKGSNTKLYRLEKSRVRKFFRVYNINNILIL